MKTLGIIAEYNPLHSGHRSHLARSREISGCSAIVGIISGNFVQRGEPAIWDKWRRTRMALESGIDLVIELPLYYATGSSGYFAGGAVALLDKMGIADSLCFGSEWGDIEALRECALKLSDEEAQFKSRLKKYLGQGLSFPAARAKAAEIALPDTPNNVLGVEYVRAIINMGSKIVPYTVPRSQGSAKEVREVIKKGGILPEGGIEYGPVENFADLDNLSNIFRYILMTQTNLQDYVDVSEGLENRLIKCAEELQLISEIISAAKTKRYTYLRLQRAALHMILGVTKKNIAAYESKGGPQYIRVLGFRKDRVHLLRLLEERASLPVIVNLKNTRLHPLGAQMLEEEVRSSRVYSLAYSGGVFLNEYRMPLVLE